MNSGAENIVKTFKKFLKKCSKSSVIHRNICKFTLYYNVTKHYSTGFSPAELYLDRRLSITLDRFESAVKHKYEYNLIHAKKNNEKDRIIEDKVSIIIMNYDIDNKMRKTMKEHKNRNLIK